MANTTEWPDVYIELHIGHLVSYPNQKMKTYDGLEDPKTSTKIHGTYTFYLRGSSSSDAVSTLTAYLDLFDFTDRTEPGRERSC